MRDGMAGLSEDAAAVTRILETTTSNVDCEAAFGDALRGVALRLKLFGTPCHAPEGAVGNALAALLDGMARSYTMAREREIHIRFALPGTSSAPQAGMDDDDDDDGLF
jgi:hypothetical protein